MRLTAIGLTALALLAACGPEPLPSLSSTASVTLERSREVIQKGTTGGSFTEPSVQRYTYGIACAPEAPGGTPAQRADRLMAMAPSLAGQVHVQIGPNIRRTSELRALNAYAVPNLQCEVRSLQVATLARGEQAVLAAALRLGAMPELVAER